MVQVERRSVVEHIFVDSRHVVEHPVVLDSSPVVEGAVEECGEVVEGVEGELVVESVEGGDSSSDDNFCINISIDCDGKRKFKIKSDSNPKNKESKRGSSNDNFFLYLA